MIFIGNLSDLAAEYRASWSGRCRGNHRTAYVEGAQGLDLRSDFTRWVIRKMKKEGIMLLQREIETDNSIIYIFRKDATTISPVRAVAEAILKFGDDPEGVPSSAINFAIAGHPHSGGQRAREIFAAYRRQWPGMGFIVAAGARCCLPGLKSHVYKKNRYHFTPEFITWLRDNLYDIEHVVYPIQARMKFKD